MLGKGTEGPVIIDKPHTWKVDVKLMLIYSASWPWGCCHHHLFEGGKIYCKFWPLALGLVTYCRYSDCKFVIWRGAVSMKLAGRVVFNIKVVATWITSWNDFIKILMNSICCFSKEVVTWIHTSLESIGYFIKIRKTITNYSKQI